MIGYRIDADFYGNSRTLIVAGEGFREGKLYSDGGGIPTIGYGLALISNDNQRGPTTKGVRVI